ncbi:MULTISPECIES: pheST operon leader peptide PheM [Enterobacterales]|uniref:pheST attenuator peptide n=1 Tax=Siccibacter colletis TaxID=1505757 RepID=A0ABY6JM08_9ENTR|nr:MULTISPECIES: pheST operon leader peptide PheM [Enterobacterales]UYU33811.1 pheST operon leader peptide PheM [Siccibacter colletis]WNN50457.1 pheST operon leader peptide PheM [Siccibacter colletis]WRH15282.1 pheST operon leader peptide PheM [Pantoea sp. JZ2]
MNAALFRFFFYFSA